MNDLSKISVFGNYYDNYPACEVSIQDFAVNVQRGDYAKEVEALRTVEDKEARDKIKAKLPAVTISGTFEIRKKDATIQTSHSGFICLDFDAKGNAGVNDWGALRNTLANIQNVYFSALSASGKGVFLIVPILRPDKHRDHFLALEQDFQTLGLTIDKAPKNPASLRGISYDPDAVFNFDADTYCRIYEPPKQKPARKNMESVNRPTGTSIPIIEQWVNDTTGFRFTEGEKHSFLLWFSYALRKNGYSENEVYRIIHTQYISADKIHSNCITSGIAHANNKGIYEPLNK